MQRMQDKEFDQLFKDRFEEAEIQPSARLWDSIAEELEPKKKAISLPVYWLSAAAVAGVILTIGLLSPKTETIKLQQQAGAHVRPSAAETTVAETTAVTGNNVQGLSADSRAETAAASSTPLVIAPRLSDADIKNSLAVVQPQEPAEHPVHKETDTFAATPVSETARQTAPTTEVMIARADLPEENTVSSVTEVTTPEHRGIRNVGDLVNFVVGKVDKRENKIVQFDTDDDDNSSLVSLNLGIIKFSKKSSK
jgi:hypothetical protein